MYKRLLSIKLVNFLFSFLVVFSCKKTRLNKDKEILVGKWEWQYSVVEIRNSTGYIYYDSLFPNNQEGEASIIFKKGGKTKLFRDGILTEEHKVFVELILPMVGSFFLGHRKNR